MSDIKIATEEVIVTASRAPSGTMNVCSCFGYSYIDQENLILFRYCFSPLSNELPHEAR